MMESWTSEKCSQEPLFVVGHLFFFRRIDRSRKPSIFEISIGWSLVIDRMGWTQCQWWWTMSTNHQQDHQHRIETEQVSHDKYQWEGWEKVESERRRWLTVSNEQLRSSSLVKYCSAQRDYQMLIDQFHSNTRLKSISNLTNMSTVFDRFIKITRSLAQRLSLLDRRINRRRRSNFINIKLFKVQSEIWRQFVDASRWNVDLHSSFSRDLLNIFKWTHSRRDPL